MCAPTRALQLISQLSIVQYHLQRFCDVIGMGKTRMGGLLRERAFAGLRPAPVARPLTHEAPHTGFAYTHEMQMIHHSASHDLQLVYK